MTQDFTGFGLPAKLLHALERMQFKTPTPVQKEAIPLALAGHDILGSAQTGTGKTGAFGIPLIAKLMEQDDAQALVMTPTRELAAQVMASMQQMIPVPNIKTALLIGGESMPKQFRQLDHNPRLIVGTPGRITDHLMRGKLKLATARFLVLDETDRMLDMGFGPQIDKIMEYMPKERQTLMFSATLPENIIRMSRKYMKEPKRIAVGSTHTAHTNIKQELIKIPEADKYKNLLEQLNQREGSVIIFVKTKYGTEKLSDKLNKDNQKSDAIHGDLQQRRRDRVIQGFRDKRYRILVATDVAARGLDIPHIEHVINYDMPQCPEDYIHRIGRTARAGAEGHAINFLTPSDHNKWNAIYRLMNPGAKPERHEPSNDRRDHRRGGDNRRHGGSDKFRGGFKFKKRWEPRDGDKPRSESFGERRDAPRSFTHRDEKNHDEARKDQRQHKPHHRAEGDARPMEGDRPRHFGSKPHHRKPDGDHRGFSGGHPKREHHGREDGERRNFSEGRPKEFRPREDRFKSDRPRDDRPREGHRAEGHRKDGPWKPRGKPHHGGFGGQHRRNDGKKTANSG